MIKILKNGREKEYFAHCQNCGTEMSYEYSDVKYETAIKGDKGKYVICPTCGTAISVSLLTEDEAKQRAKNVLFGNCCC